MKLKTLARIVLTLAGWWPLCAVAQIGPNNIITTVAGASWTFPGDGKPAKDAPISLVLFLHTDRNGNIVFADFQNHVVSRLNADGTITVLAGNGVGGFSGDGGPARNASLNYPADAVMDKNGNLYISDSLNFSIRLVTPDGVISTYIDDLSSAPSLALDNSNTLYFTDDCSVYRDSPDEFITIAANGTCGH